MSDSVANKSVSKALWAVLVVTLGIGMSACSSDKEQASTETDSDKIMAVDRVDQAADIARQNAPKAEDMDFPATAPAPVVDPTAVDASTDVNTTTDANATTGANATEEATATATDTPVATAADASADAEPAK